MKHPFAYWAVLGFALYFSGCISGHTERVADVNPLGWKVNDTVWVAYDNPDTSSISDISFLVRYTGWNPLDSIGVTVCVTSPDSIIFTEQVRLYFPRRPFRLNANYEAILPYRTGNRFARPGTYRFGFSPAEEYSGITAIGIKTDQH